MSPRTATAALRQMEVRRVQAGSEPAAGTDQALWRRLQDADAEALTALFHRHSAAVYNFAFRRTSSWASAEDVVQATFTALWRRARAGRIDRLSLDTARPLLLVMAGHECGNVLRSFRRQSALADRIKLVEPAPVEPDHSAATARKVDAERVMRQVRTVLDQIPAKQREVVELVVWAECSMADAARALGVAEGTVKSRLARARARLAGLIDLDTLEIVR